MQRLEFVYVGLLTSSLLTFPAPLALAQVDSSSSAVGSQVKSKHLSPGDQVRLTFWRDSLLSGDFAIDENGDVILPILGRRNAISLPIAELRDSLFFQYERQLRNQQVQIVPLIRVRILGGVNQPGLYFVDPTMTVGDAIATAGGASDVGKLSDVKIQREGKTIVSDIGAEVPINEMIESGDQIYVPTQSWLSRNSAYFIGGAITALAIILTR
jgi:protein involved in polysaccharide export with SLBB domain